MSSEQPVSPDVAADPSDVADGAEQMVVTPNTVSGRIDYEKLTRDFGSQTLSAELIERLERVTGKPAHPWIKVCRIGRVGIRCGGALSRACEQQRDLLIECACVGVCERSGASSSRTATWT